MEEQNKNFIDGVEDDENGFDFPSFKDFQQESTASAKGSNGYLYSGRQYKKNTAKQYLKMARGEVNNQLGTAAKGLLSKGRDVKKIIQAVKNATRVVAMMGRAVAVLFSPTSWITIVVISVILILITAFPAIAEWDWSRKGGRGNKDGNFASAASSTVESQLAIREMRELFGQGLIVSENPEQFYFSQADKRFNTNVLNGGGWGCKGGNYLKCAGCALTSVTMALRYYGVNNITPDVFANKWSEMNGKSLLISGDMGGIFNYYLKQNGLPEKKATRVDEKPSMEQIKQYISNGMPMVTKGEKICGSDAQHWVLIIGVSADGKSVVISDPAGKNWIDEETGVGRGSPARYCDYNRTNIKSYIIYQ